MICEPILSQNRRFPIHSLRDRWATQFSFRKLRFLQKSNNWKGLKATSEY